MVALWINWNYKTAKKKNINNRVELYFREFGHLLLLVYVELKDLLIIRQILGSVSRFTQIVTREPDVLITTFKGRLTTAAVIPNLRLLCLMQLRLYLRVLFERLNAISSRKSLFWICSRCIWFVRKFGGAYVVPNVYVKAYGQTAASC